MKQDLGDISVYCFETLLGKRGIKHFVSLRTGSTLRSPREHLNLSFNTGHPSSRILQNRKQLTEALGIPLEWLTTAKQVHGHHVRVLSRMDRGRGARDYGGALEATDALVTDLPGVCPLVLVADCVPVLLYDPGKRVIAAIHAGWRGTLARIAERTVRTMVQLFGSAPEEILAGIGPSIGPCCFQVGAEVIAQAESTLGRKSGCIWRESSTGGRIDLWKANRGQLLAAGLIARHVEVAGICTAHHSDDFFSYRKEGEGTGRFGAGICMTEG